MRVGVCEQGVNAGTWGYMRALRRANPTPSPSGVWCAALAGPGHPARATGLGRRRRVRAVNNSICARAWRRCAERVVHNVAVLPGGEGSGWVGITWLYGPAVALSLGAKP